jgi:predicted GH43/DUF377 family glycosyl hydrolase
MKTKFKAKRTGIVIEPNNRRVLLLPFDPGNEKRFKRIISSVLTLSIPDVELELIKVYKKFGQRHKDLSGFLEKRFLEVQKYLDSPITLNEKQRMLIGSCFTKEYSLEATALFNPSIIPHPDQTNLAENQKRFIMSLRATGEGHISSIVFRSGIIDKDCNLKFDKTSPLVTNQSIQLDKSYNKLLFKNAVFEETFDNEFGFNVISALKDTFTLNELELSINEQLKRGNDNSIIVRECINGMYQLIQSNYTSKFSSDTNISERVIFPASDDESNGIEDARFVQFTDDQGDVVYYSTYTAYDGRRIFPKMLSTKDFISFKVNTLSGPEVINKGFALFPRKINGKYAMLCRQDAESNFIMFSDNIHYWDSKTILLEPKYPWEFLQIGNCGSPLETEKGWLVLSHGVGPMRRYVISAFLLDLNDPSKIINRLNEPLLSPDENEREGYVPNVVYSCGSMICGDNVIIPYAMSDYASSIATVSLKDLLEELTK